MSQLLSRSRTCSTWLHFPSSSSAWTGGQSVQLESSCNTPCVKDRFSRLGTQTSALRFSLFIAAISFSCMHISFKGSSTLFTILHSSVVAEQLCSETSELNKEAFSKDDARWNWPPLVTSPSLFQAKDRRDCVKMHGGGSRLSRRWLGAGWELLRPDCRGPPSKHLSTAASVAARLRLFQSVGRKIRTLRWIQCVCRCTLKSQENVFSQENRSDCSPSLRVGGLLYLWTHRGTFESDLQSSFMRGCLFQWVSILFKSAKKTSI